MDIQSILMQESELIVRRIGEGTVIDHIDEGKGLKVLDALRIDGKDGSVITLALTVPSGKFSAIVITLPSLQIGRAHV